MDCSIVQVLAYILKDGRNLMHYALCIAGQYDCRRGFPNLDTVDILG